MAKRPCPCAKLYVGSTVVSSSSIDSSAACSAGSAAPMGTGCAYLGDNSLLPVRLRALASKCLLFGPIKLNPQQCSFRFGGGELLQSDRAASPSQRTETTFASLRCSWAHTLSSRLLDQFLKNGARSKTLHLDL